MERSQGLELLGAQSGRLEPSQQKSVVFDARIFEKTHESVYFVLSFVLELGLQFGLECGCVLFTPKIRSAIFERIRKNGHIHDVYFWSFLRTVWFFCFQRRDFPKKDSHVSEHLRESNIFQNAIGRNSKSLTLGGVRLNNLHFPMTFMLIFIYSCDMGNFEPDIHLLTYMFLRFCICFGHFESLI